VNGAVEALRRFLQSGSGVVAALRGVLQSSEVAVDVTAALQKVPTHRGRSPAGFVQIPRLRAFLPDSALIFCGGSSRGLAG